MKQNLRRLLLCAALTAAPFVSVKAQKVVPVGDANVDANGYAVTGGSYSGGDYLGSDATTAAMRGFRASSSNKTLNIYGSVYPTAAAAGVSVGEGGSLAGDQCPLKVNGTWTIDASAVDATINIQEATIFQPYLAQTSGPAEAPTPAQLFFQTGNKPERSVTVNVNHDLTFRGVTDNGVAKDLLVTFAGRGTVSFNMADGTSVRFLGDVDTSAAQTLNNSGNFLSDMPTPSNNAGGTKVLILMDQTKADVAAGKNKVVFARKNINSPGKNERVLIEIGTNSVLTYLSNNLTGLTTRSNNNAGYGAVAFDPSNTGTGEMVLFIRGAYARDTQQFLPGTETPNPTFNTLVEKYPFNDGALVIGGHYVPDFSPETITGGGVGESAAPGYDFSKPAGAQVVMRVIDNNFYKQAGYTPTPATRRGLLVINDVINHGQHMADPYWNAYTDSSFQGYNLTPINPANSTNNVRRGCVVAVNGVLDIYHNTFVNHVSGAASTDGQAGIVDPAAFNDYGNPVNGGNLALLKRRNPSALIIDGVDQALFVPTIGGNPFDGFAPFTFTAADAYSQANPLSAEIKLRGNGSLYLSNAASSATGFLSNLYKAWTDVADGTQDPTESLFLEWSKALTLGATSYDGFQLAATSDTVPFGEGEHVLDVEGQLVVRGVAGRNAPAGAKGVIEAGCLPRDHAGNEINFNDLATQSVVRPLAADGTTYQRLNSPALFLNNNLVLNNVILRNADATKYVDGLPNVSEPGLTGGERMWFGQSYWDAQTSTSPDWNRLDDPNRYRFPELQMVNATLELHESLNASGVRFVVKNAATGDNTSVVRFYDHGEENDALKTGFGRILQLGSGYALMADGNANYVTASCNWNVFKSKGDASNVVLSLQNGDEFTPAIAAIVEANPSFASKQRAHHLFMFSQPPSVYATQPNNTFTGLPETPVCNMSIGWNHSRSLGQDPTVPTAGGLDEPAGDAGRFPGAFPYPGREPLIGDANFFTSQPFSLDANNVPPATVSIDGSVICFGSFGKNGNSIALPVAGDNDSGVVFVKHGGKLTTGNMTSTTVGDSKVYPAQSVFSTVIAQRLWNDYNFDGNDRVVWLSGNVDLPRDQAIFEQGFAVQPYNITQRMFEARRAETFGYVRVGDFNETRTPAVDKAGMQEALFGWFYRGSPDLSVNLANTVPGTAGNGPVKQAPGRRQVRKSEPNQLSQWLHRATEISSGPVSRPTDLLYVGPGDDIQQLRVCGATMSDPFALDVSGDGSSPAVARVREFASQKTARDQISDHFISEGAHAVLFGEFGGRVGLGSRSWNQHSTNAWNLLGKDYVSICPLGSMTVDVNSNLLVSDKFALIPSDVFGKYQTDRLTFYSPLEREIRIPRGGELDLSGFGQAEKMQQIAFGGKVKLILEPGATIRMPDASKVVGGLVLYFNDESQLVFEADVDSSGFVPFTDVSGTSINNAPAAQARTRLVGKGQIWLNKDALMSVNGVSYVGVESDAQSTATDITISVQRAARFEIGNANVAGGSFQVGNQTDNGGSVRFTLALNGPTATFHIDRQGFFGLGAGVLNTNGAPNGNASAPAAGAVPPANTAPLSSGVWQLNPLANVSAVTVQNQQGIIEHYNIVDGSSSTASVMALGPVASFTWSQAGESAAIVRGGGNLMYVPASAGVVKANIWDFAGTATTGESYSVFASGKALLQRADVTSTAYNNGASYSLASGAEAFSLLGSVNYENLTPAKFVSVASTALGTQAVYLLGSANTNNTKYAGVGAQIVRQSNPSLVAGSGTMANGVAAGQLTGNGVNLPAGFSVGQ
jgi:hypothetical protein